MKYRGFSLLPIIPLVLLYGHAWVCEAPPGTTNTPSRKRRPLTLVSDGTQTHSHSQRLVSMKIISYHSLLFPLFCMAGESLVPMTGSWCRSLRRTDILLLFWLLLFSDDWDGDSSSYVPLRRLCSQSTSQQKINNNSMINTVTNFLTVMKILGHFGSCVLIYNEIITEI